MILRQFLHSDPVGISYLIGCGGHQTGAVVDSVAEVSCYLEAAEAAGVKIDYVIDTHVHADHISTGPALAAISGAKYVLSDHADVAIPFTAVADGCEIRLGNVVIEVLHTPGHTPEHICLLAADQTRASEPWMIFTGHTLMVGDLGRTELAASAEAGARALYESAQRLKALPDYLQVFPGAYAGSVCGRGLSANPISTLGFERLHNTAFRITCEEEFVNFMLRDLPAPPPDAAAKRAMNAGR